MARPRVVLDINVLISGLLWTNVAHQILGVAERGEILIVVTVGMLEEVQRVLGRPKFARRLRELNTSVAELMEALVSVAEVIEQPDVRPVVARDPDDDAILACAVASRARWIVSGDKHLLSLKLHQGIPIMTPRQFLDLWRERSRR